VLGIFWIILGTMRWKYVLSLLAVFVVLAAIRSRLLRTYERTGDAVRIPYPTAVIYPNEKPAIIRILRHGFFVVVAVLLAFGLLPIPMSIAKRGMIGSVIMLFVLGALHFFFEQHYINTGQAEEHYDQPTVG
jgi:hypothetical protein